MAYHFDGVDDVVEFNIAPISLAVFGAFTIAVFFKRASASNGRLLTVMDSTGVGAFRVALRAASTPQIDQNVSVVSTTSITSTSVWYLVVATRAAGTPKVPRFHVHNGTSWVHDDASNVTSSRTLVSGDRLSVGAFPTGAESFPGDIVCAGIKKADTADATVQTLTRTSFLDWVAFGFDWLIGFDTSLTSGGLLQDQASPGTGDEIAKTGTTVVSDPAGWSWGAAAPAFVPQIMIT